MFSYLATHFDYFVIFLYYIYFIYLYMNNYIKYNIIT